tara:strand:- start:1233 stop:1727 length:495 start_codon:yes stop_codon:yes gene_type:complete
MSNSNDSNKKFTIAAYAWLMFVTNYYRRVSDLDLNFDEMMTLNTVVTQWLYKINSRDPKSRNEIMEMTDDDIKSHFVGSRLSILSIANILNQPKESVRRRVQKLIDYQLIMKDEKGGLTVSENYTKLVGSFGVETQKELAKLLKNFSQYDIINPLIESGEKALS